MRQGISTARLWWAAISACVTAAAAVVWSSSWLRTRTGNGQRPCCTGSSLVQDLSPTLVWSSTRRGTSTERPLGTSGRPSGRCLRSRRRGAFDRWRVQEGLEGFRVREFGWAKANWRFLTALGMTRTYRSGIFWPGVEKCRDPSLGVPSLRPGTPLPQDDIWGREDSTATRNDSWGTGGDARPPFLGGNIAWFGLRAQMELSFGYLSRFGDGCYTRELWQ